ncbi:MAG: DUF86 domain-containing protein [Actinomycetota bacterium]|nr:DUF86 domain-containing protein [Actinomycetota bacterium]MDZ4179139.1 HepT-like ribonuclease domain-containing protein [Coriobacteriia bacterium]
MSSPDREIVRSRIERMLFEVDAIERRLTPTLADFLAADSEPLRYELEHRMYIALQAMLDLATHVAAAHGARNLESYRDALDALASSGVTETELAESLAGVPGLRNALAHEYAALDHARVYEAMTEIGMLRRFAAAIWEAL